MEIALTYNLKQKDDSKPPDYYSEFDSFLTIEAISSALGKRGYKVTPLEVTDKRSLFLYFSRRRFDFVFNIAEGIAGKFREAEIPALLEYLGIPYTGSSPLSLTVSLNKALTKKFLQIEGISTPNYQVFVTGKEPLNPSLRFPLIVKPNREGSGKGIAASNVINDATALYEKVNEIIARYQQEVLVEEFIAGREFTVGILENGKATVLPILEIDFSDCQRCGEYFYSWRVKEFQGNEQLGTVPKFFCPARIDKETQATLAEIALRTHKAIGCNDLSRVDIRLSLDNKPYVLEINPLPGLNPQDSNYPMMAYAAGLSYEELINAILTSARERRRCSSG